MENTIQIPRSKFSIWIQAIRPFSLSASTIPVIVAALYAKVIYPGEIFWFLFPVAFICAALFQIGANLVSDYYDFKTKVDRTETFGSSRVLVEGLLTPKAIYLAGTYCLIIGFLLGLTLVYFRGPAILLLGIIGLLGGYFYTAKPVGLKYLALGDLTVFLLFGPLMVIGAFLALTGDFSWNAFYVSLPLGFLILAILHANNTRDILHDSQANIKTLAMVLGMKGAKAEYYFLIFGSYISIILFVIFKILSPWSLLVFLSIFPAISNVRSISSAKVEKPAEISMLDVKTAQVQLIFGILLSIGILLQIII